MDTSEPLKIVHMDVMHGGALIGFSNGVTAVYSALMLYSALYQAEQVESKDPEE